MRCIEQNTFYRKAVETHDYLDAQRMLDRAHPNGVPLKPQAERQVLNQRPRQPDYSRIAPSLERVRPPAELAQLSTEGEPAQ